MISVLVDGSEARWKRQDAPFLEPRAGIQGVGRMVQELDPVKENGWMLMFVPIFLPVMMT